MVEILRSRDQTGPLWWRFSSAIVALYSLIINDGGSPFSKIRSENCESLRPVHT